MNDLAVIIPVRDGARYLGEAIRSVLEQTGVRVELLVVDDGSTDNSAAIAQGFDGVRCVSQVAAGVGAARNRGLAETVAPLVTYLDADDVLGVDALASRAALLQADATIDAVDLRVREFVSPELDDQQRAPLQAKPGEFSPAAPNTLLFRRTVLERIGAFREQLGVGSEMDFTLRLREAGLNIATDTSGMLHRRIHLSNATRVGREAQNAEYLAAIRRSLVRRRQGH